MHNRYLLESTLRFPVEGKKNRSNTGQGEKFSYGTALKMASAMSPGGSRAGMDFQHCCKIVYQPLRMSKLQEMVKDQKPGLLQSMGSQRVRHDWTTEQQRIATIKNNISCRLFGWPYTGHLDIVYPGHYCASWILLHLYIDQWLCRHPAKVLQTFGEADVLSAMAILIEG